MKATFALISFLALAGCATPQSAATSAADGEASSSEEKVAKADDAGVRCYNVKVVGTRIPKRVCTTRASRNTADANKRTMMNQSLRSVDAARITGQ
ncbi:MAG: hypothetical protein AAFU79_30100 [Myxococcota bacterium]